MVYYTRNMFLEAVGTVNAVILMPTRFTLVYETRYRLVAERIASMARSGGLKVESSGKGEGLSYTYIVKLTGFKQERPTTE